MSEEASIENSLVSLRGWGRKGKIGRWRGKEEESCDGEVRGTDEGMSRVAAESHEAMGQEVGLGTGTGVSKLGTCSTWGAIQPCGAR